MKKTAAAKTSPKKIQEKQLTLYFMRHAKAEDPDRSLYPDDSKRPLSREGKKQIEEVAEGLDRTKLRVDRLFSSPYVRARETAAVVAEKIEFAGKTVYTDALCPHAGFGGLRDLIDRCVDGETVLLVSHEPFLSAAVSGLLTGAADLPVAFKTAGVCCLDIVSRIPLRAELRSLVPARILKKIAT